MNEPVQIDMWGDIACPWCYIAIRRMDEAIGIFVGAGNGRRTRTRFHSFELAPRLPVGTIS